jgi:hypothetical protein
MKPEDWTEVSNIYQQGINAKTLHLKQHYLIILHGIVHI